MAAINADQPGLASAAYDSVACSAFGTKPQMLTAAREKYFFIENTRLLERPSLYHS